MTATKQKVIYFMRPAPLNYTVSDVSNICFTKKQTKLTVQFLLKAYIRWASMYSLEDERCHSIARPSSKLERGCGQLLNKLKSCKGTQTKCQEMCITITTGHYYVV